MRFGILINVAADEANNESKKRFKKGLTVAIKHDKLIKSLLGDEENCSLKTKQPNVNKYSESNLSRKLN